MNYERRQYNFIKDTLNAQHPRHGFDVDGYITNTNLVIDYDDKDGRCTYNYYNVKMTDGTYNIYSEIEMYSNCPLILNRYDKLIAVVLHEYGHFLSAKNNANQVKSKQKYVAGDILSFKEAYFIFVEEVIAWRYAYKAALAFNYKVVFAMYLLAAWCLYTHAKYLIGRKLYL